MRVPTCLLRPSVPSLRARPPPVSADARDRQLSAVICGILSRSSCFCEPSMRVPTCFLLRSKPSSSARHAPVIFQAQGYPRGREESLSAELPAAATGDNPGIVERRAYLSASHCTRRHSLPLVKNPIPALHANPYRVDGQAAMERGEKQQEGRPAGRPFLKRMECSSVQSSNGFGAESCGFDDIIGRHPHRL